MFVYYNINPEGDTINDCVIRALSLALEIDYYDIIDLLYNTSKYYNCDMLVRDCYGKLLKEFGCKKFYGDGRKVKDIVNDFPNNTLLLRIDQHLTCAINRYLYDIWDTSNEIVDVFWVVK